MARSYWHSCIRTSELRHGKKNTLPAICVPAEEIDATEGKRANCLLAAQQSSAPELDDVLELIE